MIKDHEPNADELESPNLRIPMLQWAERQSKSNHNLFFRRKVENSLVKMPLTEQMWLAGAWLTKSWGSSCIIQVVVKSFSW